MFVNPFCLFVWCNKISRFRSDSEQKWLHSKVSALQCLHTIHFKVFRRKCIITTRLHAFYGLFSRTIRVSLHQKGKPFWILMKQEMMGGSGISWTISRSFAPQCRQITTCFTGWMLFLLPNQQCQSTEGYQRVSYSK